MFLILFLLPLISLSHVIQDDVSVVEKVPFSLEMVCRKMFPDDSPLIDIVSGTTIDCMGRKVEVGQFCDRAMATDPYYIRAWVDKEKKQVICESGKKVLFKYLCVKLQDRQICNGRARESCLILREKIAKRLELVHSSEVKNEKGIKQLNCFFETTPPDEFKHGTL